MEIYKHFKGKLYEIIGVSKHCDSLDEFVVYRSLYGNNQLWIRPKDEFFGYKIIDNKEIKRFTNISSIMDTYLFLSKEIRTLLESNGYNLESVLNNVNTDLLIKYGLYPESQNGVKSKDISLIILTSSIGASLVLYAIKSLIKTISHKPVVLEYEELEEVRENGNVLKDENGLPVWKKTRKIKVVEFNNKTESNIELSSKLDSNGIEVNFKLKE